jgi:glycosyltransferase involved in cell wall biosynthesis
MISTEDPATAPDIARWRGTRLRRPIVLVFRHRLPTAFSIENLFDALFEQMVRMGAPVSRLEVPHVSSNLWNILRNAAFIRRRCKGALVHVTGDVHYVALLRPFAPAMITVHDCVTLQRGTGFKRAVLWLLWFGLPLSLASRIVAISEKTRQELRGLVELPEARLLVIPNFVNPEFRAATPAAPRARVNVLHVGTSPNKNLARVIAALEGLRVTLVVVGQIDDATRELLEASSVDYENHVAIDDARLRVLYEDSDIVSFPSTYEGFGMPILEAQAIGRPVLTSDLEPMKSVAGEGGALLVNPHSTESIRSAFRTLIDDDSLRMALRARGFENVGRYRLEHVAEQYLRVYESLDA